jgi:hypothetical protein
MADGDGDEAHVLFVIDPRRYPHPHAARLASQEASLELDLRLIAAVEETVKLESGTAATELPDWPEYRERLYLEDEVAELVGPAPDEENGVW